MNRVTSARNIWDRLHDARQASFWEEYASWTIPSVCRRRNQPLQYDYQSVGAMLVNSLSAKLAQVLFPPNSSFFKLMTDDSSIEAALAEIELSSSNQLFDNASYAQLMYALQSLIITGNTLLERTATGFNVYSALDYVVDRDLEGNVRAIVIKQIAKEEDLSPDVLTKLNITPRSYLEIQDTTSREFELYTLVYWDKQKQLWISGQYIDDIPVHESEGQFSKNLCPYIPVRWSARNGEWFGRGQVEMFAGDFLKLSALSRALADYEDGSTNVKVVVSPNSSMDVDKLEDPESGLVILGEPNAIQALEFGQYQKIQALQQSINMITQRLSTAFMLGLNQRQGERVTAYEVQLQAQDAEITLGGVYSLLSQSLHLPLAYLLCYELDKDVGAAVAAGEINVQIITGVQALSRNAELQQWVQLTQELGLIIPTLKQVSPRFNVDKVIERFMLGHGVSNEFLYTPQEMQAILEQQQQQLQQTQYQERTINSQDAIVESAEQLGGLS